MNRLMGRRWRLFEDSTKTTFLVAEPAVGDEAKRRTGGSRVATASEPSIGSVASESLSRVATLPRER